MRKSTWALLRVGHRRVDRRHRCHTQLRQPVGGRGRGRTQPRLRWSTCSPGPPGRARARPAGGRVHPAQTPVRPRPRRL